MTTYKYIIYAEGLIAVPYFVDELNNKLLERCRTGEIIIFSANEYRYCKYGVWNAIAEPLPAPVQTTKKEEKVNG